VGANLWRAGGGRRTGGERIDALPGGVHLEAGDGRRNAAFGGAWPLGLGQAANSRLRSWKIPDDELVFAVEGGHLVARVEGAVLVLEAQSADRFFETEQGFTFVFEGAEGGQAAAVAYSFRGRRGRGRRVGAG